MGRPAKEIKAFIEGIPDSKLRGFGTNKSNIHKDVNFRLDMQSMTSDKPAKHNLQVQINYGCKISSLAAAAPQSVSIAIVPANGSMTPRQIKDELIRKINTTPGRK